MRIRDEVERKRDIVTYPAVDLELLVHDGFLYWFCLRTGCRGCEGTMSSSRRGARGTKDGGTSEGHGGMRKKGEIRGK